MFQRVRSNSITPLDSQRHLATAGNAAAEEELNKRLKSEIDQLLGAFGDIIQTSRIYTSGSSSSSSGVGRGRRNLGGHDGDSDSGSSSDDDDSDGSDGDAARAQGARPGVDPPKDKYVAAQEAYGAQTRAAIMVRSVENLMSMVADIKRAYLVNDTDTLTAIADQRRRAVEERVAQTRAEIEALNSTLTAGVRELEAIHYAST
ncbi:hypothetical protein H4R18_003262 [Coemansia javaensis]|uniref:Uncharacterized protein n=1 Tax=Coemansia javaensis TaxID=2761396 RepID=A0A9W8HG00_9FUNG|nr:hypothetical protein H4R18_003262 [Coemansia javaensis]